MPPGWCSLASQHCQLLHASLQRPRLPYGSCHVTAPRQRLAPLPTPEGSSFAVGGSRFGSNLLFEQIALQPPFPCHKIWVCYGYSLDLLRAGG